jgi:hypothetical protein
MPLEIKVILLFGLIYFIKELIKNRRDMKKND